ncbi:DUF397 domain-containing protein [Streptomyces sp. NPDC052095]|uniref:DUF397 domain-containing protein n=1 Tax=unclassified Streptomyces TaxID=2593676 RepID=UPI00344E6036
MTSDSLRWFTSSHSSNGGAWVEVAADLVAPHGVVPVRDSKNAGGPVLRVSASSFASFITGIRSGNLDAV